MLSLLAANSSLPAANAGSNKLSTIQWWPQDCKIPLLLPENEFDLSHFGKGQYRIDGGMSRGHFNAIYIIFQAAGSLDPVSAAGANESTFNVKDQKVTWRSYKTSVEGQSVIRKEAMLPNICPHQKVGNESDFIWIRIDADSEEILQQLTPVAEGVLQDTASRGE